MRICTICGNKWETNYCPKCACTIDRGAIVKEQSGPVAGTVKRSSASSFRHITKSPLRDSVRLQMSKTKSKLRITMLIGIVLATGGLLISIGTYEAAKSAGGGTYYILYGPVLAGILLIIKAIIGFEKIGDIEREIASNEAIYNQKVWIDDRKREHILPKSEKHQKFRRPSG